MSEPTTNESMEAFALNLTNDCTSRNDWLAVVRFGMPTLLEIQPLFIEIIFREARNEMHRHGLKHRTVSDEVGLIFKQLGLKLVLAE